MSPEEHEQLMCLSLDLVLEMDNTYTDRVSTRVDPNSLPNKGRPLEEHKGVTTIGNPYLRDHLSLGIQTIVKGADLSLDTHLVKQLKESSRVLEVDWSLPASSLTEDIQTTGGDICIMDETTSQILAKHLDSDLGSLSQIVAEALMIPIENVFIFCFTENLFWVGYQHHILLAEENYESPRDQHFIVSEGNRVRLEYYRNANIIVEGGAYLKQS